MSVLLRDVTGRAPSNVLSMARRFGARIAMVQDKKRLYTENAYYDGFVLRAEKRNKHVTVKILAPQGIWWLGGWCNAAASGTGGDITVGIGYIFPSRFVTAATNPTPTAEADILTFSPDSGLQFPKRHCFYGTAPSVAAADIKRWRYGSPALNGRTAVLPSAWYDVQEGVEVHGWRSPGHITFTVSGGDSTFVHMEPTEAEAEKTYSQAIVNWQAVVGLQGADFGTDVNIGPYEGVAQNLWPTPFAANVLETTPETIDGVVQPLRYNDFVVATPVTVGQAPANIGDTRYDGDGLDTMHTNNTACYANPEGIAVALVHMPYDKDLTGLTAATVTWGTTISMLDSGISGVPPGDETYKMARDSVNGWLYPTGGTPNGGAEEDYHDGYVPHHITSFNCAVREPVESEPVPPRGVAVGAGDPQLLAVVTSWTEVPDGYCFSTRGYSVALSDGNATEFDISTATRTAVAPEYFDPFDHHYVYAACGQAVPLVKVGIDCDPALITSPPTAFQGQEELGSTELKLVYADGTVITHDLGDYCPPRPIMRGGTWKQYVLGGIQQFGYNSNDPGAVSAVVAAEFSRSPDTSGALDTDDYTSRRTVIPELCAQQRICVNLGSGRVATLACTEASRAGDVRLDWSLVVTYEDDGSFDEVRGVVFEDLPLESSCWISLNVVTPEAAAADGSVARPAVLVASVRSPTQFVSPFSGSQYLFPIHARDSNYPSSEEYDTADGAAVMVEYHNEIRVSRDGGATWETMIYNVGTEAYFMGSAIGPLEF